MLRPAPGGVEWSVETDMRIRRFVEGAVMCSHSGCDSAAVLAISNLESPRPEEVPFIAVYCETHAREAAASLGVPWVEEPRRPAAKAASRAALDQRYA